MCNFKNCKSDLLSHLQDNSLTRILENHSVHEVTIVVQTSYCLTVLKIRYKTKTK